MRNTGIILIIMEVIIIIQGRFRIIEFFEPITSAYMLFLIVAQMIGYLLPGIIGVILLLIANKRRKKK